MLVQELDKTMEDSSDLDYMLSPQFLEEIQIEAQNIIDDPETYSYMYDSPGWVYCYMRIEMSGEVVYYCELYVDNKSELVADRMSYELSESFGVKVICYHKRSACGIYE